MHFWLPHGKNKSKKKIRAPPPPPSPPVVNCVNQYFKKMAVLASPKFAVWIRPCHSVINNGGTTVLTTRIKTFLLVYRMRFDAFDSTLDFLLQFDCQM